jgi:PAS domain S-box-containing protein
MSGVVEQAAGTGSEWPHAVTGRLLEMTVDLACVASFDGYFVQLSDGWTDLLGYPCDELVGRPFLDFVDPDDVAATAEQLAILRTRGEIARFENRFVAQDGSRRWLVWCAIASQAEQRYHAVARDLTLRREADERVRESERRYLDLIESAHDIVQSIAPDGHFDFVNRAWHELLGYTPEELPALTLFDIVDPGDHDHCNLVIGRLMSGQSIEQVEVTFVTKDGRRIPVEGNASGRFRGGDYVATHAFFRDMTEKKRAEALSAQYQQQLEQEVAERTAALVQSEKLATLGRLSAGMAHELNNPATAAQRGAVRLRDALAQTCGGFLDLAGLGLTAADAARLAALVDLGASRAKSPDTVDPLSRSDREAVVESWLEAHGVDEGWELSGPLVSLGLGTPELDALAEGFPEPKLALALGLVCRSHLAFALMEQITHGTQRISEIVTALKDYSYMDRAPVQDIDVHAGLDNTLVMLQGKLKQGVEVERAYGQDLPLIEARGSELNQVWTNLIDNAADAMDASGRLVIRTSSDGESIVVEIEDDGPGIAADHVDKVFEPFFTTKLPGQGTGLGLNIVFNIVRGSGGQIDVRSEPGSTVFTVRIPIRRATADTAVDGA